MGVECSTYGLETRSIQFCGGKHEEKIPLAKYRCRRVGNINMDLGQAA
jgi:hypothetical protein